MGAYLKLVVQLSILVVAVEAKGCPVPPRKFNGNPIIPSHDSCPVSNNGMVLFWIDLETSLPCGILRGFHFYYQPRAEAASDCDQLKLQIWRPGSTNSQSYTVVWEKTLYHLKEHATPGHYFVKLSENGVHLQDGDRIGWSGYNETCISFTSSSKHKTMLHVRYKAAYKLVLQQNIGMFPFEDDERVSTKSKGISQNPVVSGAFSLAVEVIPVTKRAKRFITEEELYLVVTDGDTMRSETTTFHPLPKYPYIRYELNGMLQAVIITAILAATAFVFLLAYCCFPKMSKVQEKHGSEEYK